MTYVGPIPPLESKISEYPNMSHSIVSPGDNEVIFVTHPPDGFDNLTLIVFDDFNPLQLLS